MSHLSIRYTVHTLPLLLLALACGDENPSRTSAQPSQMPEQLIEQGFPGEEAKPTDSSTLAAESVESTGEAQEPNPRINEGLPSVMEGLNTSLEEAEAIEENEADEEEGSEPELPTDEAEQEESTGETCPFEGNIVYELNGPENWPEGVEERLTAAMDDAIGTYNCYADLSHSLTVNYNPGVPTAEANVDGWMSFGSDRGYMVVATAMHEIAHTMGVGFYPWAELLDDGRWSGQAVNDLMAALPTNERDPDQFSQRDYITADRQHFWPYGLNQAAEHQSEWSLINHVRLVAAMQQDKQTFLSAQR